MHITLPPDQPRLGQVSGPEDVLNELLTDPVWKALQGGIDQLAPHINEDEIRSLMDKLHEHKMMDQLQDLLSHLPEESQELLDRLQEPRLQSAS